jgi:hypothetical protein
MKKMKKEKKILPMFFLFALPTVFLGRELWYEAFMLMSLFYLIYVFSGWRNTFIKSCSWIDVYFIGSHIFIMVGVFLNMHLFNMDVEYNVIWFLIVAAIGYKVFKELNEGK